MGNANNINPESFALIGGLIGMAVGILFSMVLVGVFVWLIARVVAGIPPEHHRLRTGRIWGFFGVWVLLNVGTMIFAFATYRSEGDDASNWQFPILQFLVGGFFTAGVLWIMLKVPEALKNVFATFPPEKVPAGDHGRILGLWIGILCVLNTVFTLVGSLIFEQGNPLTMMRKQMEAQQEATSPVMMPGGELAVGCVNGLLGLIMLVLLIVFVVRITKEGGSLKKLQQEADRPEPAAPPSTPLGG